MVDWERVKLKSDILISWLSLTGAVVAAVVGLLGYQEAQEKKISDQQQAALDFIARYNSTTLWYARARLQGTMNILASGLPEALSGIPSLEAINLASERYYAERAAEQMRSDGTYISAMLIVRFFDELLICMDAGICDQSASLTFFADEAYQYQYAFGAEIDRIQKTRPNFGLGLESIASTSVGK